ncbi:MAG: hypothetical protein QOI70_638, partial [Microbacteriaceae bacterium]|nr:hypothetical protein [Microbacteriaceae bacterium]
MNSGAIALGICDGMLIGLVAVGLVLVYRANQFLNLAHGVLGAVPALLFAKLVAELGWSQWLALPLVLAVGIATAVAVERIFVAPLRRKGGSNVVLLLLTLGVSQLLLALTLLPALRPDANAMAGQGYPVPVDWTVRFGGINFGGNYVVAVLLCPLLIAGLTLFLRYSMLGKLIRATASNPQAAQTCGIPPRYVSGVVWAIAGALATTSAILSAPSGGLGESGGLGSVQLLLALGAAAFGAFVSIPMALAGGLLLGVCNSIVVAETGNAGTARLVVFVLILLVITLRGRSIDKVFAIRRSTMDPSAAPGTTIAKARGVIASNPMRALAIGGLAIGLLLPNLPTFSSQGQRFELTLILIYAIVGVSLTMLVGWGGQLSLGHIAIVGVGAFVAARLAGDSYSLVTIVLLVAALGAGIAVVIGLPALRVRGLTLAVSTLGFAVVASEDLFRSEWFTSSRGRAIPMVPVEILRG